MTTTISKQELQQQQHQQQQQQHQQQQHQAITIHSSSMTAGGGYSVVGAGTAAGTAAPFASQSQFDTLNNNYGSSLTNTNTNNINETPPRRSLLNFKSLDFHIKSLYSGLRTGSTSPSSHPISAQAGVQLPAADGVQRRMPYLRIESVDPEGEPGGAAAACSRRESVAGQRLQVSPSLLSPYSGLGGGAATGGGGGGTGASLLMPSPDGSTIRRSSTSDIVACRRGGGSQDSRRPSTSDLLRRARERRGSEARMGRSVSQGGLTRGGGSFGGGLGGRRTSMAF